ncbi:MAG: hypothetical protein FWF62_00235 [Candidatus Bathyarchaeota archaeon]|nr:hypothetical protein [Candidatus Termiticorpusculum sp.]
MDVVFRISHNWFLLVTSLLFVVLFSSLFVGVFMNGANGASLENVIHFKNEDELKNAVNKVYSKEVTIALDNDVTLTNDPLTISANKDVTLRSNKVTGFYKLIGASDKNTIVVEDGGVVRLDGIIVTHKKGVIGCGVYVLVNEFI